MPASQVMMVLVLGGAQWALVAFLMAGAGVLVWAAAPEAFHLGEHIAEWVFKIGELRFAPRYWSQGIFGL